MENPNKVLKGYCFFMSSYCVVINKNLKVSFLQSVTIFRF